MALACPHCGSENTEGASFCRACGKALPNIASAGPRFIEDGGAATTIAGTQAQNAELRAQIKKASGALLIVAILQVLGTVLIYFLMSSTELGKRASDADRLTVTVVMSAIAVLFFGLYAWSRKNPFPAAVVGLVVFVTIHLADALVDPTTILQGIIVKIIVVAILIRAVKAGVRYRQLKRQATATQASF